ncbi:metallophosphoesterase [Myxococcota bacterium]|nr:metallophosphoesterase [Myxococcota bacterium]
MRFPIAILFVSTTFSVAAWRLLGPLALPTWGTALAALVVAALFGAMMLVPLSWMSRSKLGDFARRPAVRWLSYMSMAFVSVLFALVALRDLVWGLGVITEALSPGLVPGVTVELARASSLGAIALATVMTAWGYLSVKRGARTVRLKVRIPGLPKSFAGFRIVQLSDIHIGESVRRPHIERLVRDVNALDADLVAITGDLVDGSVAHLAEHAAPLAELSSKHGTHFVAGNHDHYSGIGAWAQHLRRLGMTVLHNEHRVIRRDVHELVIAGVDDLSATDDPEGDLRRALRGASPEAVRVLLAHHPKTALATHVERVHLQLSGHTHGGQFFPWNLAVKMVHGFAAGLYRVGDTWLYVSRGTFYWGPPVRLFAPAEITVLELEPAR